MTVHKTKSLKITLQADANQLWIECQETLESEDFREGLVETLEIAKEHSIRQWLIDARKIGELTEEDESWAQLNFFPQLMQEDSTCYIAMVIAPNCYDRMLQESGWFGLKSYNSFIRINTFYDITDAENWLQTHKSDTKSSAG